MRILKITGGYPPSHAQGGTATAAHFLMKHLKGLGHDVYVITTNINGKERIHPGETVYDGVPVCYCSASNRVVPYYSPEMKRKIIETIEQFDVILLDSTWTWYGVVAGKILSKHRKAYIIYSHGCLDPEKLAKGRVKKKLWWTLFDKKLYNRSSAVVALTMEEKRQLESIGVEAPIYVIPNGVEVQQLSREEYFKTLSQSFPELLQKEYFLYLGRFEYIKGLDILLKAYEKLLYTRPDVPLLVLAGPYDAVWIRKLKVNSTVLRNVRFTGLVSHPLKDALIYFSKAMVLASRSEGLPMSVLEALSLGKPVVITDKCNLPQVEIYGCGIVTRPDCKSFYEGLHKFLSFSLDVLSNMSDNALKLARNEFSWKKVAMDTEKLIYNILQRDE